MSFFYKNHCILTTVCKTIQNHSPKALKNHSFQIILHLITTSTTLLLISFSKTKITNKRSDVVVRDHFESYSKYNHIITQKHMKKICLINTILSFFILFSSYYIWLKVKKEKRKTLESKHLRHMFPWERSCPGHTCKIKI